MTIKKVESQESLDVTLLIHDWVQILNVHTYGERLFAKLPPGPDL